MLMIVVLQKPVHANDVSISAALSTPSLTLDTTAFLTVTVHGARSAELDVPGVDNLIIQRRGQSSKMQVINGEISSSITYTYVVQPLKEGNFTIPPLTVRVKNKLLATEPLALYVVAEASEPTSRPDASVNKNEPELAFLTISRIDDKVYTGQILPVEIKAYFRRGVRVEIQNLPMITGEAFVLSPLSNEPRQTTETVKGTPYSVISWNSTISPIKEGIYDLALSLDATLLLPQKNSRSQRKPMLFGDDFFDDEFFNGFFGGIEKKNIRLSTDKFTIDIIPLPEKGKPLNFNGAIGDFDIDISALPLTVEVGDPITLTMTISGKGNFDRVSAPVFSNSQDWKTYSPASRFESSGNDYEGKKIFEQAIVAKNSAVEAIPSISFSYFNPEKKVYITKSSEPLPLTVEEGATQQEIAENQQQIPRAHNSQSTIEHTLPPAMPIYLTTGDFVAELLPIFQRFWFIIVFILTTILLLGVFCTFILRNYREKNKILLEKRKLEKNIKTNLDILKKAIIDQDADSFITILRETIQKKLAYYWQLEASAITLRDLQKRLPPNSPLIQIFLVAEQHAYGKAALSPENMHKYLEMLRSEVE